MADNNQEFRTKLEYFKDLTGDVSASAQQGLGGIGERIKAIREEKELSLEQLSNLTGFDIEFLANIEADKVEPQLGTLMKLAKALDSAFVRLVSGVGDKFYSVTRKGEQKIVSRSTSQKAKRQIYKYGSLAPEVKGRHMEALIVQLEENPDDEMSIHEGEEFLYVLDGVVSLKIGEDMFDLEPGDSVYYLSTTPHLVASKSGRSTILAVLYEG